MNLSWARSLGKFLLWLGGGLFAIVLAELAITVSGGTATLTAWRELLGLVFLASVMVGTALVVTDVELGGSDDR